MGCTGEPGETDRAGAEAPEIDARLETLPTSKLAGFLDAADGGGDRFVALVEAEGFARGREDASAVGFHVAYGLLKLLSDDRRSRAIWAALVEQGRTAPERPRAVLGLWRLFETREGGHDYLKQWHRSLAYHRRYFFDWFLTRYELARARAVLAKCGSSLVGRIHFLLLGAMLLLAGASTSWPVLAPPFLGDWRSRVSLLAVAAVYALAAGAQVLCFHGSPLTRTERWIRAGQSLVPRLGAASVVGLVILASSEELFGFVLWGASWWRTGVLLAASFVYLLLEMSHRIQPLPGPRRLVRLSLDVLATALAHGLAIGLCAERALRSIPATVPPPLNFLQLVNVAAFLLAIGLIVNLIWAEEPVTQPL